MSDDLTLQVLKYREAARHVWSAFLREDETFVKECLPDGLLLDHWEAIQDGLFAAMVLRFTGEETPETVRLAPGLAKPLPFLKIVPTSAEVPAHVSRAKPAKTYWDHPVQRLSPGDDLRFIGFFDWDSYGFVDLKYFRVQIWGSQAHPEIVGHEALVEVQYARVHLHKETGSAP